MNFTCAIIDDDPLAISILESYITKFDELIYVGSANNAGNGRILLDNKKPDLLFLDVEMPGLNGIEFLQTLLQKPYVIISSAKKEYAADGFDLEIPDYIVKPVTFQRFAKSIHKFFDTVKHSNSNTIAQKNHFFLNENKRMVRVNVDDIKYIESLKDYVRVVTVDKQVVTKEKISFFEDNLPLGDFLRVHKSFIVSLKKIDAYSATSVEIGGVEIPIGRNYKDAFFKQMQQK